MLIFKCSLLTLRKSFYYCYCTWFQCSNPEWQLLPTCAEAASTTDRAMESPRAKQSINRKRVLHLRSSMHRGRGGSIQIVPQMQSFPSVSMHVQQKKSLHNPVSWVCTTPCLLHNRTEKQHSMNIHLLHVFSEYKKDQIAQEYAWTVQGRFLVWSSSSLNLFGPFEKTGGDSGKE